ILRLLSLQLLDTASQLVQRPLITGRAWVCTTEEEHVSVEEFHQ
ncbi:hypothetical protein GBAR_LOCUS28643, partial [Geodia barretti]